LQKVPGAREVSIGETPELLADGHRLGSYSALHVLRGLAVWHERGKPLADATEAAFYDTSRAYYEQVAQGPASRFQHLINHSDCDGYYVPYSIPGPLLLNYTPPEDDEDSDGPQQLSVGSSLGLLRELDELAPLLALAGDLGELGEADFGAAADAHRWPTAAWVWGVLHCYARESVLNNTVMIYC